jgi:hypothetical protein
MYEKLLPMILAGRDKPHLIGGGIHSFSYFSRNLST